MNKFIGPYVVLNHSKDSLPTYIYSRLRNAVQWLSYDMDWIS